MSENHSAFKNKSTKRVSNQRVDEMLLNLKQQLCSNSTLPRMLQVEPDAIKLKCFSNDWKHTLQRHHLETSSRT
ncbi:hypothetical protein CEXT_328301 [Caerostris extrusa]|uniref:Uncharacterized protein n=1 Tax=Caerostris extrusa TaxID=172846 RepID=A0AAV4NBR4_CAEEX|nr:hypothetical protein CEXT_328301 [Caerostris extrusa]